MKDNGSSMILLLPAASLIVSSAMLIIMNDITHPLDCKGLVLIILGNRWDWEI